MNVRGAMTDEETAAYVDAACTALGLALERDERDRVIGHFARTVVIAAPLLALELPPNTDPLPVFLP